MGLLSEVAVGVAVIALPQGRLPLLGLTACVQGVQVLSARRKQRRVAHTQSEQLLQSIPAAEVTFEDVSSILAGKKGAADKVILQNVSGCCNAGRLLALMGPSGSGKTSLLNALAEQTPVTKGMVLSGRVRVNGLPLVNSRVRVGYVQQEDLFYSQMTVKETLDMTAALRLPRSLTQAQRDEEVAAVMAKLDLAGVAGTVVGDKKVRGVSGGERKRLAIACELLSRPSLLFLDEPTTGLDAFQALKVMEALKALAHDGHTVVAAIHQPRSRIFELFDDLLLLSGGRIVYSGAAAAALAHFSAQGHDCPQHYNPAEFLADLISPDASSEALAAESGARVAMLISAVPKSATVPAAASAAVGSTAAAETAAAHRKPPLRLQLRMLFKRSWRQVTRDKAAIKLRILTNVQSAAVFGCIWWRLRCLQQSVLSRIGLLQVIAVSCSQSALFKTLNLFPSEKALVCVERAKGSYDVLPYFLSKVLAELPIIAVYPLVFSAVVYPMTNLQATVPKFTKFAASNVLETLSSTAMGMAIGSVSPTTEFALVLGPAIMLVFIVFGGLYTNQDDVPRYLKWVPNTSGIKTGYDALCKNEFSGLELDQGGPGSFKDGDDVLRRQGFSGSVGDSLVQQCRIMTALWWITYCILKAKKPKFQAMEEPSESAD